ncbi:hypothetical protein I4U23_003718 [Adineta vaga]|nr:hypothetical protein I4U23_003718 [Adineta vaga]
MIDLIEDKIIMKSIVSIEENNETVIDIDESSSSSRTILVWKNLLVETRGNKRKEFFQRCRSNRKILLHNLNGVINGGLWAVMGPSGSGKSTLLNTLACRLDVNTTVQGEMHLNGAPYNNAELKRIAGYVMQDDLLNGELTIEETLMYTAKLRLPRTLTNEERQTRVESIIKDLGLDDVHDRRIGSSLKQGISGSERKRLCVGMQLISRPQLLFLDEPTTGLDSVAAFDLLQMLYELSHGKFHKQSITIDTFQQAGFPCPLYTNPADHLLDVVSLTKNNIDEAILAVHPSINIDLDMGFHQRHIQMNNLPLQPPWLKKQIQILLQRNFQQQQRQFHVILVSLIQSIIMGVLIGIVFFRIDNTQRGVFRRESILFSCIVNQSLFAALMIINSFPIERTLTLRERASGTYYASAYFLAKIIIDTLVQLPVPIIFSCIVYFLVGFQATVSKFFLFMLFIVLCSMTSTSIALMISTLCKTTDLSITVLPMILEVSRLFGGFLLAPSRIPKYFAWLDALSYFKYSYVGLSLNEYQGLQFQCNNPLNETESCLLNGEAVIHERGFDYLSIPICIGVLFAFIVVMRIIAFLGVRFRKH